MQLFWGWVETSDGRQGANLLGLLCGFRRERATLCWIERQLWVLTVDQNARVGRDVGAHAAHRR